MMSRTGSEALIKALGLALRRHHSTPAAAYAQVYGTTPGTPPGSQRVSGVAEPAARPSASPFLSWLPPNSANKRIDTPLTHSLPGTPVVGPYRAPKDPPPTEITTLSNGVQIISEASPGPTASIGIYVNSGSIYEQPTDSGSSALLECLAFKSTTNRNTLSIMKEVERAGATLSAMASREQMSYTMDCLKTCLPQTLELLCDAVLNPCFHGAEVAEQKARLAMLLQGRDVGPALLNEQLVRHAYAGALSHPLIPDPPALAALTPEGLHSFVKQHYAGKRLVLAAAGVEHQQLVELAAPMLSTAPVCLQPPQEPASQYKGACVTIPTVSNTPGGMGMASSPLAQMVLAFEYPGGWRDIQGAVAMTVFTYLMGGGDSFSSGGPGKGMHSRLYTRVLNAYHWVHSCSAFNATFNNSGLVGIQASCEPGRATDMLNVMCREMEVATRSLSVDEVERAKRTALATIYNALESKATSAEDMGRQFLTYNQRISGRQYADMIEAVTPADIAAFVSRLLDSKPSLALHGDGTSAVSYEALLQRYAPISRPATPPQQVEQQDMSALKRMLSFGSNWRS